MDLKDLLILLVEPSRVQRNIIAGHLRSLGINDVEEFSEAAPALERMEQITPDVVMSAMHLPDMTGSEMVNTMRMRPELADVTFFLISSETMYRYLEPVRQAGATAILPKPFDPEDMLKALESAVHFVADRNGGSEEHDDEFDELSVLVVDDSQLSRNYIERILQSIGIQNIREAKDGAEALQMMKAQVFDLVITDYNMPNIDGLELVHHIRQYTTQQAVPIIVVTSEQNQEPLQAFENEGVSAVCSKPLSYDMLKTLIRHLIKEQHII